MQVFFRHIGFANMKQEEAGLIIMDCKALETRPLSNCWECECDLASTS